MISRLLHLKEVDIIFSFSDSSFLAFSNLSSLDIPIILIDGLCSGLSKFYIFLLCTHVHIFFVSFF